MNITKATDEVIFEFPMTISAFSPNIELQSNDRKDEFHLYRYALMG
jgi:hypothetical protein